MQLLRLPQCVVISPSAAERISTENDRRNELYQLEVSRLSARSPVFRDMLLRNKSSLGFTEKPLFDLNTLRTPTVDLQREEGGFLDETGRKRLGVSRVTTAGAPASRQISRGGLSTPDLKSPPKSSKSSRLKLSELHQFATVSSVDLQVILR
jgi:hypothetical protein